MRPWRIMALLGCWLVPAAASAQVPVDPNLEFEIVVSGLVQPTTMEFIGPDDMLVLQKRDGRVLRVINGVIQPGEVLDVAVFDSSERGLLGITLDPDFINNRYVYIYYTESSTGDDTSDSLQPPLGNRVYRYRWDGTALVDPLLIMALPQNTNHNGGILRFGPDDRLYVVIGDTAHGLIPSLQTVLHNAPLGNPPDDTGVIFRVDSLGRGLSDNPFFNADDESDPMNRYWAYGIRNSFGFTFDPVTGDLWETENGPENYDEVNRYPAGSNGGHAPIWGPESRDAQGPADLWHAPGSQYVDPKFSWNLPMSPAAIDFIRNQKLGCGYLHDLIVGAAGFCRHVYHFELDASRENLVFTDPLLQDLVADNITDPETRCEEELAEIIFAVAPAVVSRQHTDIDLGPDGLMYFTAISHGDIRRLVPKAGVFDDVDGDRVDAACDCAPGNGSAFAAPLEVPRIRVGTGFPTTLGWDAQGPIAGDGTTYAVVTGSLAELRSDNGFARACTLTSGGSVSAAGDNRVLPGTAGDGFYYLVRAGNDCSSGTFGNASPTFDPRDALDLSWPSTCP